MEAKDNTQRIYKGLVTDFSPNDQPADTYRYAMNVVNETNSGDKNFLATENGAEYHLTLPNNAMVVGRIGMTNGEVALFSTDGLYSFIGLLDRFNNYTEYVRTTKLDFSVETPITGVFRIRRSMNRVVYFVYKDHAPCLFNFDRVYDFYNIEYSTYLSTLDGTPDNFVSDKWDELSFNLIKKYNFIPEFQDVEILNGGDIPSGSYSIAIQLIDENLSSTEWITSSNPVNIYIDNTDIPYSQIRGSRNAHTDAQNFSNASKSIKWTIGNFDPNFAYYRVAVICANGNDGNPNKVLVSNYISTLNTSFVYAGNDGTYTESPITDIIKSQVDISSVEHIEQIEERLLLAGIKGKQVNWCNFQRYASQIKSELTTTDYYTDDIESKFNPKNPVNTFESRGYMWDEVYSFGIVYVFSDGFESPVFHIPGRPSNITGTGMDFYECDNSTYVPMNTCLPNEYWGSDGYGNGLLNQKIRHHKFPERPDAIVRKVTTSAGIKYVTTACGIKFTNIVKPHTDIIGYRIVRNERNDDNKLVVDNAFLGPMTNNPNPESDENNYHSFGLLTPGIIGAPDIAISKKTAFLFSPEHQFYNKRINFDTMKVNSAYYQASGFSPITVDEENGNGLYLHDVRAGTTFNSEYNKGEDPDGFDLQVLYRVSRMEADKNQTVTLPSVKHVYYLSAANYATDNDMIIFNASSDNKIIALTFDEDLPDNTFTFISEEPFTNPSRLLNVTLIRNNTGAYSNFMMMDYYREHNNIFEFTSSVASSDPIYNGDCYTSGITITNTTYYDTVFGDFKKKNRIWKIVLGSLLVVGAIAVSVMVPGAGAAIIAPLVSTLGLSTAAATAVLTAATVMAISQGISMITSGIQFETLKNMIDQHYESGLRDALTDSINKPSSYMNPTLGPDDKFEWFADTIANMYIDSSVNIAMRSGLTAPISDFINTPMARINLADGSTQDMYEIYLANKLTVVDRERNDGRLYLGFASAEIYDVNKDYMRFNKQKIHYYLPMEYDCCAVNREYFPNRIHYSEKAFQEELLDNYRVFLPNNYRDIEAQYGKITNLFRFNNALFISTNEALFHLPQNLQEQITQELTTFIGTGEFLSLPLKTIGIGSGHTGGSSDKFATILTPAGVFIVSRTDKAIYMVTDKLNDISNGNSNWFKNNLNLELHNAIERNIGKEYVRESNPIDPENVGIHATYDRRFKRIIVTKVDYKPIDSFSLYSDDSLPTQFVYDHYHNIFGVIESDGEFMPVSFSNDSYFENRSWTMSFSTDNMSWTSWHSYIPNLYIDTPDELYAVIQDGSIYRHNVEGLYRKYYGEMKLSIVEIVALSNPVAVKMWNHINFIVEGKRYDTDYKELVPDDTLFFDKAIIYNDRQSTGLINLIVKKSDLNNQFLSEQIIDSVSESIVNNVEGTWNLNHFRDMTVAGQGNVFSKQWSDIKHLYPIDKVVNSNVINRYKSWTEQNPFMGKYLIIRLILSNFDTNEDVQLILNYSNVNEQYSLR